MSNQEHLELELKELIIETLALEDLEASDISHDTPLFGDGLGLDSIDALELGVAIQKRYKIKINAESEETKENFFNVRNLASFISKNQAD